MSFQKKRLRLRLLVVYLVAAALIWVARPTATSLILGLLPVVLGEGIRLRATGYLHKTDRLTVAGPYGFVRHPLYLGTLLISVGFAAMASTGAAYGLALAFGLIFFAYYLPYKNRIEGARLESLYGDEYRRYAAAVPRVIPRLYRYVPVGHEATAGWTRARFSDNNEIGTALTVSVGVVAMWVRWAVL